MVCQSRFFAASVPAAALVVLALLSSGCTMLPSGQPVSFDADPEAVPSGPVATCEVQLEGKWGKPQKGLIELRKPMTVQSVIEQSQANRKFNQMEITIERTLPEGNRFHRIKATYDARERAVPFEQDYAILPGDRVIITEINKSAMDLVLQGIAGPMMR